ncbi:MAG TPA: F0F1 ATP synthase subunit A [Abditibacteriaceae bacterium]|nr:F0F1 ATP synthase subunit A [Abditibacteriaceae bacterium]
MFNRSARACAWILILTLCFFGAPAGWAQEPPDADAVPEATGAAPAEEGSTASDAAGETAPGATPGEAHGGAADEAPGEGVAPHAEAHVGSTAAGGHEGDAHEGGAHEEGGSPFEPHSGTLLNGLARALFGESTPRMEEDHGAVHVANKSSIRYDYIVIAVLIMLGLATLGIMAGKQVKVRPEGKPHSLAHVAETLAEAYQNYLVGVMGEQLALKYTPLVGSFFFTILFCNWVGLVPGLLAPTSNPNVPVGLAIVAFFSVHIIAIKEAGFKSWIMHFVGEPIWLAWLNFPLHIMGELIKPVSLSLRLLCNIFGEEMVIGQIALMAIGVAAALHLPAIIPLQLPFMMLGVFFGFLQALVFSTLLAIYISILSNHHDDHDEHNVHGHVEHVRVHGHHEVIAHPTESPLA